MPLLDTSSKGSASYPTGAYSAIFVLALFPIAGRWKPSKCHPTDKWMIDDEDAGHIHYEYYSAVKKKTKCTVNGWN